MCLPDEKLARTLGLPSTVLDKKATKCEILSLVGLLKHAAKVVRCGRSFVSKIYATADKLQELKYSTYLNNDFLSDLSWWHTFFKEWNEISSSSKDHDFCIQTDSSGSSAFVEGEWLQVPWNKSRASMGIMVKE